MISQTLSALSAPLLLAISAFGTTLIPLFIKNGKLKSDVSFLLSIVIFGAILLSEGLKIQHLDGLISQGVGKFSFEKVIAFFSLMTLFLFHADRRESLRRFEAYPLVSLIAIGSIVSAYSSNLLVTYVSLELSALGLYVLVAMERENHDANESAMKYFLLGSIASAVILFGIALIFGMSNASVSYLDIQNSLLGANERNPLMLVGIIMFISGIFFKLALFPFQLWVSDVYKNTSSPALAIVAIIPKIASLIVLYNFLELYRDISFQGQVIFDKYASPIMLIGIIACVISMVIGSVGGVIQEHIKRLLAYSSVANAGYFVALLFSSSYSSDSNLNVALNYLIIYSFATLGLLATLSFLHQDKKFNSEIVNLAGLAKNHKVISIVISIFAFSMAGIPPFAGFFAKFDLFIVLLNQKQYAVSIIAILTSAISAFYYLKIVKAIYLDEPTKASIKEVTDKKHSLAAVSIVMLVLTCAIPIYPSLTQVLFSA